MPASWLLQRSVAVIDDSEKSKNSLQMRGLKILYHKVESETQVLEGTLGIIKVILIVL